MYNPLKSTGYISSYDLTGNNFSSVHSVYNTSSQLMKLFLRKTLQNHPQH
jgi:hypothetical protein